MTVHELRSLAGRIGAHESWSRTDDRAARTAPARANSPGSLGYWERKVDPDGELTPRERVVRAEHARSAHMARLTLARERKRRKRRTA